jgi:hypothetical protein
MNRRNLIYWPSVINLMPFRLKYLKIQPVWFVEIVFLYLHLWYFVSSVHLEGPGWLNELGILRLLQYHLLQDTEKHIDMNCKLNRNLKWTDLIWFLVYECHFQQYFSYIMAEALVYALSAPAHVQVRNLNYHIPFTFNTK